MHGGNTLPLVHELFEEKDALIFENCEAKSATLIGKNGKGIKIEYQDMNNLLVWSAVGNAPFVALEPWTGLASCSDEDVIDYCNADDEIEVDEDDFDLTVKSALDYITEITADKMLEEFSADDIFDLMFTATYAFEQDFTFDFEDYDEMQAFIDTNHDQLDNYKEEYPSVMNWIEAGMIC